MMKETQFRDAGALPGGVRRRAEAVVAASGVPCGRLAPSSSSRPLRALAGAGDGASARAGPVRGRAQRLAGWGLRSRPAPQAPRGLHPPGAARRARRSSASLTFSVASPVTHQREPAWTTIFN